MKNHPQPIFWPTRDAAAVLRRQHGAFLITFALFMLFLLGFMGIALDFGRLFVVKSELQTAMDSCALAAARELNGQADAIARAQSAGMVVGNGNRVNLQSATWNGQGKLTAADISFRDQSYADTTSPTAARYAECEYTMGSIQLWLLQAMGAFTGDRATWSNTGTVGARAVATRAPSQTACIIPVVLPQGTYTSGQWITFDPKNGPMTWGNLIGTTDANTTNDEMRDGYCAPSNPAATIYTPGTQATVAEYWNFRFGIYKNNPGPNVGRPDYSSYVYNTSNWQGKDGNGINTGNAYQGSSPNGTPNFMAQRLAFKPCGATPDDCGLGGGGYKDVAQMPALKANGGDRRIVVVPIVAGATFKDKFACMLMLNPVEPSSLVAKFEYLGLVTDFNSPCTTSGFAGGTNGPLVPVLVR